MTEGRSWELQPLAPPAFGGCITGMPHQSPTACEEQVDLICRCLRAPNSPAIVRQGVGPRMLAFDREARFGPISPRIMNRQQINKRLAGTRDSVLWTDDGLTCEISPRGPDDLNLPTLRSTLDLLIDARCLLAPTSICEAPGGGLTLHWGSVGRLTYCWEWPSEGWRDAARVTVRALRLLRERGLTLALQPWDLYMAWSVPMIANPGAIVPWSPECESASLECIQSQYVRPLKFAAGGHARLARRLLRAGSGLSVEDEGLLLNGHTYAPHPSLSLETWLDEVQVSQVGHTWVRYRAFPDEMMAKRCIIQSLLSRLRPRTVLDIGCNTGHYSLLATKFDATVIGLDADEDSVNVLYRQCASSGRPVAGVVMDMNDPSQTRGWGEGWCAPAERRLSAECVIMMALLHHLLDKFRMTERALCECLSLLTERWLILEFVRPRADRKRYGPNTEAELVAALSNQFVKRESWHYGRRERSLLLFQKLESAR